MVLNKLFIVFTVRVALSSNLFIAGDMGFCFPYKYGEFVHVGVPWYGVVVDEGRKGMSRWKEINCGIVLGKSLVLQLCE